MELFTTLQSALVNQIKAAGSIPVYINVMISMMPLGGGTHSAGLDLVDPVDSSHRACLPLPGQTPSTHQAASSSSSPPFYINEASSICSKQASTTTRATVSESREQELASLICAN